MTRSVRSQIVLGALLSTSMAIVASVIAWLTGWSLLWMLIVVMSTCTLVLYWLRSRRQRRAQHDIESRPGAEQKV